MPDAITILCLVQPLCLGLMRLLVPLWLLTSCHPWSVVDVGANLGPNQDHHLRLASTNICCGVKKAAALHDIISDWRWEMLAILELYSVILLAIKNDITLPAHDPLCSPLTTHLAWWQVASIWWYQLYLGWWDLHRWSSLTTRFSQHRTTCLITNSWQKQSWHFCDWHHWLVIWHCVKDAGCNSDHRLVHSNLTMKRPTNRVVISTSETFERSFLVRLSRHYVGLCYSMHQPPWLTHSLINSTGQCRTIWQCALQASTPIMK